MTRLNKLKTYIAMGPFNVARVGLYRIGIKTGLHPVLSIKADKPSGPFFNALSRPPNKSSIARKNWAFRSQSLFGRNIETENDPPKWHENPFTPDIKANSTDSWWEIADFDPQVGDIKAIWEASRFDWLLAMAQRAAHGDENELVRLNVWIDDWLANNPPYKGANWKCGQETSIRVIHLAVAALILNQIESSNPALDELIELHLKRILPTIGYAIGQANNHGTSEAAALFIGGSWLSRKENNRGAGYQKIGRRWLENRARVLIEPDGSFSQYSVNYHRLMLDTYCIAEIWRRRLNLESFSTECSKRIYAATDWLEQMTNGKTGDAPNIGANDGAQILALTDCGYRDFRPTVQLASALFRNRLAYDNNGPWNQQLHWLNIFLPKRHPSRLESVSFDDGGYHILRKGGAVAYLRYPRFRFRPSQADALHCDLFIYGENIFRDAGTYSYNSSNESIGYFNGTIAHNTVEFDNNDQMRRLGRFLFGDWLKTKSSNFVKEANNVITAAAAYRDVKGNQHERELRLEENSLRCVDRVSGFENKAILRWRLKPGKWKLDGNSIQCDEIIVTVLTSHRPVRIEIVPGQESRHYLEKNELPVLEIEIDKPGSFTTIVDFK